MRYVLSILVDNNPNVMARISALFARRGFNMSSVTAAKTNDPHVSIITIVTEGDERIIDQCIKQTQKLLEVRQIKVLPHQSLFREMLILKISLVDQPQELLSSLRDIVEVYRARIVDLTSSSMVVELTGKPVKIEAFLEVMSPYSIVEMCRSGIIGMERGQLIDWWKSED